MSDYPKYYVKGADRKVSHNVRDDVRLEFAGYRVKEFAEPLTEAEQTAKAEEVASLTELVKHPEAKGADVVDKTEADEPKPTPKSFPKRPVADSPQA